MKLPPLRRRIILISGTPVLNSAMELYPLLRLLDPNIQCQQEFARRYFQGRNNDFGKLKYTDPRREEELHAYLFKAIGIRRKKEEVLSQLPPKRRQTIFLREGACRTSIEKLQELESSLFPNSEACQKPCESWFQWTSCFAIACHNFPKEKKISIHNIYIYTQTLTYQIDCVWSLLGGLRALEAARRAGACVGARDEGQDEVLRRLCEGAH